MQDTDNLSAKQEKFLGYLLGERTLESACAKSNVSPTTAWRWLQTESFRTEYRRLRRGVLENTIMRLQAISLLAIETLERNLSCESPAAEIRAAQIILEQSIRGLEIMDLEDRIVHLEDVLAYKENQA